MATRTAYAPVAGEVLTASNLGSIAGGWIGYVEVTANQASISTEVDLTGLTVTVSVGTTRRLRIHGHLAFVTTVTGGLCRANIKEGATQLQQRNMSTGSTSAEGLDIAVVLTPTAGTHTYKLTALLAVGTGTMSLAAASSSPAYLIVEDLGAA